jgi:hypothetical protein
MSILSRITPFCVRMNEKGQLQVSHFDIEHVLVSPGRQASPYDSKRGFHDT